MNWKALAPLLGVILLAALAFAFWPEVPAPNPTEPFRPTKVIRQVPTPTEPPAPPTTAPPLAGGLIPVNARPAITADDAELVLDLPDSERLRELGVPERESEPEDAGVLRPLDRVGFKNVVREKMRSIQDCYARSPQLRGKVKMQFAIVQILGRERAKITKVDVADAGVAFETCVRDAFRDTRFDVPRGGQARIAVPVSFGKDKGPTP